MWAIVGVISSTASESTRERDLRIKAAELRRLNELIVGVHVLIRSNKRKENNVLYGSVRVWLYKVYYIQ